MTHDPCARAGRDPAADRRAWPRLFLSPPEVAFCALAAERPLLVRVADLSLGGLRVLVPELLDVNGDLVVEAVAEVVWLGGLQRGKARRSYSGLRFCTLAEPGRAQLEAHLAALVPG